MRAVVKPGPGPGMELRDVPTPGCGPSDVLIRVHAAGVCGTDLHIWEWDAWASGRLKPPLTIGHEFAGRIEQVAAQEIPDVGHDRGRGRRVEPVAAEIHPHTGELETSRVATGLTLLLQHGDPGGIAPAKLPGSAHAGGTGPQDHDPRLGRGHSAPVRETVR